MLKQDNRAACDRDSFTARSRPMAGRDAMAMRVMAVSRRIGAYDMLERQMACWAPGIEERGSEADRARLREFHAVLADAMAIGEDGMRTGCPNLGDPLMQRYLTEGYLGLSANADGSPRVWWKRYGDGTGGSASSASDSSGNPGFRS